MRRSFSGEVVFTKNPKEMKIAEKIATPEASRFLDQPIKPLHP
jgi:hypothetical protein